MQETRSWYSLTGILCRNMGKNEIKKNRAETFLISLGSAQSSILENVSKIWSKIKS